MVADELVWSDFVYRMIIDYVTLAEFHGARSTVPRLVILPW